MNYCFLAPFGGDTDLLAKAKSLELGAFGMNSALISCTYALDAHLEAAYKVRCPEPYEHENRRDLIRIFNIIAKELYGNGCPVVVEFGSFVMNMFSSESDLDLSINFNNHVAVLSKKERVNALRKFAKKFRKLQSTGLVKDVLLIPTARVPVLKVTDRGTNIECDFSVENRDGIAKSHIVSIIATIDERLRKLSIMLKAWAKAHSINSSKDGTLNSLSLILLAAFHLQCTEPPILPPFSSFFRDGSDPSTVKKNVAPYVNYGERNKESLIQLFVTLLIRLKSVETLWDEGLCASVYEGSWIYKRFKNKLGISVEDFTDRSQNVARALQPKKVRDVYQSIDKSLFQIQNFVDGKIKWQQLEKLLFGPRPPRMTKKIVTLQSAPRLRVLHPPTAAAETKLALKKEGNSAPSKDGVGAHGQSAPLHPLLHYATPTTETQLAPKTEGNSAPSEDGVGAHGQSAPLHPVLHDATPTTETQLAPKTEGNSAPSEGGIRAHDQSASRCPVLHDPTPRKKMCLTEKKKKKKKKGNSASSKGNKKQQPRKQVSPRIGGISQGHIRTHKAEAFDRRASYATQNPIYMQRSEGSSRGFVPSFAHEASSSQSYVAYPRTLPYISYDPSYRSAPGFPAAFPNAPLRPPPQLVAGYPPMREPAYDPYFQQASQNIYRTPQVPYPGRLEHYRTPEVPYSGRLERIWSDYSSEVRREVPYPGRAQTWAAHPIERGREQAWSDHPNEAPRGAHRPHFYR